MNWRAFSRGININSLNNNQKSLKVSETVTKGLAALGIPASYGEGFPTQLTDKDIDQADLIVALNQKEHQPMLEKQHLTQNTKFSYWDIGDSKTLSADRAIPLIDERVQELVKALKENMNE